MIWNSDSQTVDGLCYGTVTVRLLVNSDSQTVDGLCYRRVTVRLLMDYAIEE